VEEEGGEADGFEGGGGGGGGEGEEVGKGEVRTDGSDDRGTDNRGMRRDDGGGRNHGGTMDATRVDNYYTTTDTIDTRTDTAAADADADTVVVVVVVAGYARDGGYGGGTHGRHGEVGTLSLHHRGVFFFFSSLLFSSLLFSSLLFSSLRFFSFSLSLSLSPFLFYLSFTFVGGRRVPGLLLLGCCCLSTSARSHARSLVSLISTRI